MNKKKALLKGCHCQTADGEADDGDKCKVDTENGDVTEICKLGYVCKSKTDKDKDCDDQGCKCYEGNASIRRAIHALLFLGIASF